MSPPQFPTHNAPRVWLITSGDSPVGISLSRQILHHGDYVVSGIDQVQFEDDGPRGQDFKSFLAEVGQMSGWRERMKVVALDIKNVSSCQAAIGMALHAFEKIDILFCCTSQAVIGTVEEFSATTWSQSLVRDQFESNFFGPMNIIKAIVPEMRNKMNGHIMVLTGITGHIGTPGLGMYCASGWALEGFCDSIAYEIAPFNIKLTIVQASIEIGLLTNRLTAAPQMSEYSPDSGNTAPLFRNLMDGLLNRLPGVRSQYPAPAMDDTMSPSSEHERQSGPFLLSQNDVVSLYPPLGTAHAEKLVAETVHALTAIGGHENPPGRHIVGIEGVASVKEKLKTVSEELEEFVDASAAVDLKPDNKRDRAITSIDQHPKPESYAHEDVHPDVYDAAMVLQSI